MEDYYPQKVGTLARVIADAFLKKNIANVNLLVFVEVGNQTLNHPYQYSLSLPTQSVNHQRNL
jgi:hypothetical protein